MKKLNLTLLAASILFIGCRLPEEALIEQNTPNPETADASPESNAAVAAPIKKQQTETFTTSNGVRFPEKNFLPSFSWDTVPLFMMFADSKRLLKEEEIEKISSESGFLCIEKQHGVHTLGTAEKGLAHETKAFKARNPDNIILGYFNSALTYSFASFMRPFKPDQIEQHPDKKAFLIKNKKTGELEQMFNSYCLNVLNKDMRDWWSDVAAKMIHESGADGIFIDQMHGFGWLHGRDKQEMIKEGLRDMMQQLKDKLGPDKMFLANNSAGLEHIFPIADAFMFEHYKREATHTKEKLLQDWALMEKIADAGKICVYRFSPKPEPDSALAEFQSRGHRLGDKRDAFAQLSKEQLPYYLALYLIGAQPYSYFQWNWAWDLHSGPLEHYPEFHRPLGKPLGKYKRLSPEGWEFTREFEHAKVWVDTDKSVAKIDWF